MEQRIQEALTGIERRENVRILYAAESGSRAWGFASPDSDYDVRFVYVRPAPYYLKLEARRDVLELPMDGVLDVNGWDLDKTLRLLHASNPTLFEWFSSPVVYRGGEFTERFRPVMERCFRSRKGLWHYLSMAKSNCGEYLKGEQVKLKNTFTSCVPFWPAAGYWSTGPRRPWPSGPWPRPSFHQNSIRLRKVC